MLLRFLHNQTIRDVSIGFTEAASISYVLMTALIVSFNNETLVLTVALSVGALYSIVTAIIGYLTLKKLYNDHQHYLHLQNNPDAFQTELLSKKQFLANLGMEHHAEQASHDDLLEISETEKVLTEAPPTIDEARSAGLQIFWAAAIGFMIPILPILIFKPDYNFFFLSIISLIFIALGHFIKSLFTGTNPLFSTIANTFITFISAVALKLTIEWIMKNLLENLGL